MEGHEGDRRDAGRRPADRAAARDGRPRRGAHGRHDPRQRLLDRADAVPGHEGLPRAARSTCIEMRGPERICVAAACDWGESRPLAVPEFILEMRRRGHPDSLIRKVVYENPIEFLGQSPKFRLPDREGAVAVVMEVGDGRHLTYCTNIHPAVGWDGRAGVAARARAGAEGAAVAGRAVRDRPAAVRRGERRAARGRPARATSARGSTPRACTCSPSTASRTGRSTGSR